MLIATTYGGFMCLNKYKKMIWVLMLSLNIAYVSASNDAVKSSYNNNKVDPLIAKQIQSAIYSIDKHLTIDSIEVSPIENLYTVMLNNGQPIYTNIDGSYIMTGAMLHVKDSSIVNLTDKIITNYFSKMLSKLDVSELICYKSKGSTKGVIYVFTDVNCFYCQKFHQEIAALNDLQIEVRILAFPRSKKDTNNFNKLVNIWSSTDPKDALDKAMSGNNINYNDIPQSSKALSIVEQQQALGLQLGITGTPSIILENGEIISGYVKPEVIVQKLNINK
jgi:thiol:disulfide interchange protein DsbC